MIISLKVKENYIKNKRKVLVCKKKMKIIKKNLRKNDFFIIYYAR